MEKKYTPSPEAKKFIEDNINLINNNEWKAVFSLVKEHDNHFVNEFVEMMDSAKIGFLGLDVYKYNKAKNEFQNYDGQPIELDELRLFLLKHRVCVPIDYETEKIIIIGLEVRDSKPICETPRLAKLFNDYSKNTLEKAKSGNFKDLIHFATYHTIERIGLKKEDDMIEYRWREISSDKAYLSELSGLDLTNVDLNDNTLLSIKNKFIEKCNNKDLERSQLLGYYSNKEVYLCDELIKEKASLASPSDLKKQAEFFEQLYKKVFTHEMGHLVFDWVGSKNKEKQEKQANYFSSYINDGTMDKFIKDFTKKQPKEYRNPYLKGDTRAEELYK